MRFYLILTSLLLSACSTLPLAFEDPHITKISYAEVNADIESNKNTLVRWGGVIADVKNDENFSWMEVIFYPLDYYGRPKINKPSEGRFVIKSPEFLDPKNYAKNREIITVGVIEGRTEHITSPDSSELPLITATAIHLWPINYRDNYYGHCRFCYFMQLFW
ncbi:outer membrane lipoprotein [Nitrosomonas sp. Nm34]|nr:outer membrane lipoprotein [Nitrosomonas sp. Nm34]